MPNPKKRPVDTIRLGSLKAAIWQNESEDGRVRFSVTFQRSYFDRGDEVWKETDSFGRATVLELAELSKKVYHRVCELEQMARQDAAAATT